MKKIYGASSLKASRVEFERLSRVRAKYPGAVAVRKRCFAYVEQLFDYPSAVRKIMYTINAIEAVNFSFRKVTKRGAFPNDNSVFKSLYLRVVWIYNVKVDTKKDVY
ncbi:MAG: transposase [Selenomonadaceae bacterium]|nr:transposase [Selenomonadaceae bacterium]